VRQGELARPDAGLAPLIHVFARGVEMNDPTVAVAVRHKNIATWQNDHVGGSIEVALVGAGPAGLADRQE